MQGSWNFLSIAFRQTECQPWRIKFPPLETLASEPKAFPENFKLFCHRYCMFWLNLNTLLTNGDIFQFLINSKRDIWSFNVWKYFHRLLHKPSRVATTTTSKKLLFHPSSTIIKSEDNSCYKNILDCRTTTRTASITKKMQWKPSRRCRHFNLTSFLGVKIDPKICVKLINFLMRQAPFKTRFK